MCRPSQTPHLTMSSARIDPPKRVLGLKEGVVTPPPIHGLPKEPFPVHPPADTRRSALATLAAQAARQHTTGRERHSVLRIFKGRRECTGHHATCGALPAAGPYLRLSRFQGGQAVKQKR
ncbi:unnamed protein product [Brassica oleracea]